jgi:hypothetical protein
MQAVDAVAEEAGKTATHIAAVSAASEGKRV